MILLNVHPITKQHPKHFNQKNTMDTTTITMDMYYTIFSVPTIIIINSRESTITMIRAGNLSPNQSIILTNTLNLHTLQY